MKVRIFDIPRYAITLEDEINNFFKSHPKAELMQIKEFDNGNKLMILYKEEN